MTGAAAAEREPVQALLRTWQSLSVPLVLFVSHERGTGVGRHMRELAAAIGERARVLVLVPGDPGRQELTAVGGGPGVHASPERMLQVLAALGVDRVHFHHVHGFEPGILELPAKLGVPYDVTLHDYLALCPAYHLLDGEGRFCGGDPSCRRCDERRESPWPLDIDAWRATFAAFLRGAARVIAPSEDCARRHAAHIGGLSVETWPHPRPAHAVPARAVRVLVPGALSRAKGLDLLDACVEDARRRALPLHFRVLGYLGRRLPTWPDAPLSVSGEYAEGRLPELLAAEGGDVVFFAARCPETYSYTLSDALDTSLAIVAPDLGAFPERLRDRANARLFPHAADAAAVNDALLAAGGVAAPARQLAGDADAYAARYLQPIVRREATRVDIPVLLAEESQAPERRPHAAPLSWLYADGVEGGKAGSRQRLQAALADLDPELEQLRRDRARLAEELDHTSGIARRYAEALERAERELERQRQAAATAPEPPAPRPRGPLGALSRVLRRRPR